MILFSDSDWQRTQLRCMQTIARTLPHVAVEGRAASASVQSMPVQSMPVQSMPVPGGSGEPQR